MDRTKVQNLITAAATAVVAAAAAAAGAAAAQEPKYNELKPTSEAPHVRPSDVPFRTDEIEIVLPGNGARGGELEYKFRMKKGQAIVYSWSETGTPADEFYFDLHGHATTASANGEFDLANYHKESKDKGAGSLVAAVDGVHGWFFQNGGEKTATVTIKVAGFYELIPPGEVGNEAGIKAKGQR